MSTARTSGRHPNFPDRPIVRGPPRPTVLEALRTSRERWIEDGNFRRLAVRDRDRVTGLQNVGPRVRRGYG